ncbi:mucin-binding protein [Limosilactobacillus reuteri]|uniref:mucin-binding protein n=1 Tax=Limosilactobacillus reuteri TaxID=1598 RepID=UPI001C5B8A8C|nr:KxYKxGKxW signal peptide domain-containing protein [Limosilactobacillus reuteri]MBW3350422.1 KxYKxGKxW signal peptide domain-containing protein [Limosilactobacillus reuteri]UUW68397.1 KxYKxGKxW signal peptide domain-containing protein [Limosilactobacillus reuteri]
MEEKKHYKLYKSGKLWMTAMISAAVLGSAGIVHADVTSQSSATTPTDTSEVVAKTTDLGKAALTTSQTTESNATQNSNKQESTAPVANNDQEKKVSVENNQNNAQNNTEKTTNPVKEQSSDTVLKSSVSNVANNENKEVKSVTPTTSATFATDENIVSQRTVPQANSTITVSNPTDYPTQAAKLVGKNSQGQPYYIYQIVNLRNTTLDSQQARLILAVDPANPQGNNFVYVTTDQYKKIYGNVYVIAPGRYADIAVGTSGSTSPNGENSRIFRVSNTQPFTFNFNGKTISVPASVSIKSIRTVNPVYGLGNQEAINYTDKVDITPELNNPAIEYIYRDKDGNYTTNSALPTNVPVNGITGQRFLITNVDNYKQVVKGYYLTNQKDSLSNTANGKDYQGTISQFQIGKYYQKTLYNWDRSVSQTLIYELLDPQGAMNISLVRPNAKTETKRVAVGQVDRFSNGTLARNPFVPGANAVQLVYADLGHIIPVDENGKVISQDQPIYNNDENDAHKAAATASPDLAAEGWVLSDPKQATITPANPGEDTKVEYRRVIINTETKTVTQTVKYEYADGITEGRPSLPSNKVQTATFTHTVITNPVTGDIISDTWTPAQKFTTVYSPKVVGFYADFAYVGGNDNVTQNTPDTTFVVKYAGPNENVEHQTVTQTVHYQYKDGITEGRPALPQDNVQQKSFTHTVKTDPEGNIIEDTWTPDQADNQFTAVKSPNIHDEATDTNYYYDQAVVGGNTNVTQSTPDTEFIVYYLPGNITTQSKSITQTVHYAYRDGVTQGRPALPTDNVQRVTFTQKIETNPFTGDVAGYSWDPIYSKFDSVQTPELKGFYADQEVAGGDPHVIPEDSDTTYTVYYAAPVSKIKEEKQVTQTITYEYADGITANRPTLPRTDVQTKVFYRTVTTNPWTDEVISDTWSPAQNFTVVQTPTINGYYYDQAQAGNDTETITQDSPDTEYTVKYAPAKSEEVGTKNVTQTIRYHYAEGVTGDPALLPQPNVQTLTFTRTLVTNPFTDEVISDTWSPAQKFSIVATPTLDGYYANRDQAGSDAAVNYDDADTEYVVKYAPAKTTTETKNVTQTVKYVYADGVTEGRPALPDSNVQSLTFTRTILTNPWTDEVISDTWSPAQKFSIVKTPNITGYYADQAQAGSDSAVTHENPDTEYIVQYAPGKVTTEDKTVTQTIKYEYADGVTEGRPTLPADNTITVDFTHTIIRDPWTDEVVSDTWSPAQTINPVESPTIDGFTPDHAEIPGKTITYDSENLEYVVKYTKDEEPNKPTPEEPTPEEPATPEKPNEPAEETPTPSQPQPTVPAPEAPVQQPTKPVEEPSETPVINQVVSAKPVAPNKEANNKLPQTGNQDSTAIIGLGLVTAFASLFGFGKRKSEK